MYLKKEGTVVLSMPNNHFIANLLDPAWFHRPYKASQLFNFLREIGFQIEVIEYGGGVVELISMRFLYVFKLFGMDIPFKKCSDRLRDKKYAFGNDKRKFVTIFLKVRKVR